MTTFYLLILFMLPAVMAVGIAIPRRRELSAQWIGELVIATALLVLGAMLALCRLPVGTVIVSPVVGLSFTFGGFQRLYGLVVCLSLIHIFLCKLSGDGYGTARPEKGCDCPC